ncbi:peroxide-responsive transcriptional repressor PerR [Microaerobacter geothermalis]|uniref:peroxide-responsive transcriptional repressor PerR n=1 Tax=Microaerobacter geothermalis TaxID=674972 RepID=UPI001EEA09DC|nr:peroxide-responsive transcriptional repressor PerR [Microaerobacter geothermalis]MCF6095327.1 peroxide-responsive transcriptional repressor PerR [Microaerobacter geothermalis]
MAAQRLHEAIDKLKSTGVRMTPQRHAILAYLLDTKSHPTADDIYKALEGKFPNMSVATVYNNLRVFKEVGLVQELTYGDASSRFDADVSDHYHIICMNCGRIDDYYQTLPPLSEVERSASEETGYDVKYHRMELYGFCPDCKQKH